MTNRKGYGSFPLFDKKKRRSLLGEAELITLSVTVLIIVVLQLVLLASISAYTTSNLKKTSIVTADETVKLLQEPLYKFDSVRAQRIGEALLQSGRVSGIKIVSEIDDVWMNVAPRRDGGLVPPQFRAITYGGSQIGTVELYFSDEEVIRTRDLFFALMVIMMLVTLFSSLFVNSRVLKPLIFGPLEKIGQGIDAIASGAYETRVEPTGFEDVDSIVNLVNNMASKIYSKNIELTEANNTLEKRVSERTAELKESVERLSLAQDKLIEAGKLSALGQLAAGIAHELNTPIGSIKSSGKSIADFLEVRHPRQLETYARWNQAQRSLFEELIESGRSFAEDLDYRPPDRKRFRRVADALQLAGFPDPVETAGHLEETGLIDRFDELLPRIAIPGTDSVIHEAAGWIGALRMSTVILLSVQKAATVVDALRSYLVSESVDFTDTIEVDRELDRILVLMHNQIKHGVNVLREYGNVTIRGSAEQLSQVWMNLVRNALQSMNFQGTLTLRTRITDSHAIVSVIDSGPGIPEEIRDRIFDPFFSTKKHESGMGLGLDICRKIVESHKGTITFESRPGNTAFSVIFPVPEKEATDTPREGV